MLKKTLAAITAAALLTACGNQNSTDTKAAAAPQDAKHIHIATESSFKPFSYLDNQGNLVGFEIDLANALCEEMKAHCEISSQDWDGLIPSLKAKKFDAIMAGMSVTPERSEVVDFTDDYFKNSLVLIAKKDANIDIDGVDGKTIATQQATLAAEWLAENKPKATVKAYDKQDSAYLDLSSGRVDAMLSDAVPATDWLSSDAGQGFEIKSGIDINDSIAIAVRKDDALKGEFNTALAALKANGKYDELVKKYNLVSAPSAQ